MYMHTGRIAVALRGPPWVIAKTSVKSEIVPRVIRSMLIIRVGRMIGRVTRNSRVQYDAPSSWAASSASCGTFRRPALSTSIENAVPRQALARHTIRSGAVDRKSLEVRPISSPSMPPAWLNEYQMKATQISGSTQASTTIEPTLARTITCARWPSSARARPSTVWATIPEPTTKMRVSLTLDQKTGSCAIRLTLARPAATAGSPALAGAAGGDAFLVARLRAAGAVIIGKANLSEWANFRSTHSVSGWSTLGGQAVNPHGTGRNPSGSSSGSAVAVAAGLAPLAVGTETDGSIISPAHACGIVGVKPTLGLVSRAGIVPISLEQDTAGPMTRCVADAAALLGAMAGNDPADEATAGAAGQLADYTAFLDPGALAGARIGIWRSGSERAAPAVNA